MLKQLAYELIAATPLPRLMQRTLGRSGISVFTYHAIIDRELAVGDWSFLHVDKFERQMAYLSQYFHVLPVEEAFALQESDQLPTDRPVAVVTFDDGFLNNYSVALPVLQRYQVPATIFLATGLLRANIGQEQPKPDPMLWFCRLHYAFMQAVLAHTNSAETTLKSELDWRGTTYLLHSVEQCQKASFAVQQHLKALPGPELELAVDEICNDLGVTDFDDPLFHMLDSHALDKLLSSKLITFGGHTSTHAILARLDRQQQSEEVKESLAAVAALTGKPCHLFAYTNGGPEDYNQDTLEVLDESGVKWCWTMVPGENVKETSKLELHRYGIGADDSFGRFVLQAHHLISQH